jgi:putative peptide zinc metalloprotease protein
MRAWLLGSPRRLALFVAAAGVAIFLSVVASRTDVVAIVDTGDGDETAFYLTLALLQSAGGEVVNASGGDNYAVALNTEDGTTVAETAFLITYAASGVVDQENAAVAYASCDSCSAFAAAIEVIFVPADKADTVTPTNLAVAVNEDCTSCTTMALATQIVIGVDGPVRFTEEGNAELEQIQEDLAQLEEDADELSPEEFKARYDEIVARLRYVLENELETVGGRPEKTEEAPGGTTGGFEETSPGETTGGLEETVPESTIPEGTSPTTDQYAPEGTASDGTTPEETTPPREETVPPAEEPVPGGPSEQYTAP